MKKSTGVTLIEVAKKAGVARMTASRALSGDGYITEETKAKVLAAAAELGYTPNALARAMKGGRTNVIGAVVNDLASTVINAYVTELSAEVRRHHMDLFIYNAVDDFSLANGQRLDQLLNGLWDGLIYVMPRMSDEYLAMLEQSSRPVVLINYCKQVTGLPVINGDNFNGARDATHHLIDLGHRRIAFIRGFGYTGQSEERERGYRAALDDAGIVFDPELVQQGDFSLLSGAEATERLLGMANRPTAIFAANDEMAAGSMQVLQAAGLTLPQQVSLIGFDDAPIASFVQPKITTLRHPIGAMAKAAVQELLLRINNEPGRRQRVEFPSEFLVRESTAAAPPHP
ncbi:LacI family DNA-binding transcriptional regulator [Pseudoduganella lutea]|nr:LacI family DNA-binding transcriptional regulator [Pseudoduganella lutea]